MRLPKSRKLKFKLLIIRLHKQQFVLPCFVRISGQPGSFFQGDVTDVTFKFVGCHHVQAAMRALVIIKVYVLSEVFAQVISVVNRAVLEILVFQDAVGAFHKSVVVATVAHADEQAMFFEFVGVFKTAVL